MEADGGHEVAFFGHRIPAQTEHKWLLLFGLLGALGTVYLVLKNRAAGAVATSATKGTASQGSSATGSSGSTSTPATPLPTIEFKFSEDTSNTSQFEGSSNVAQGGGGGLNVFGLFSLGGGGGGSNVKSNHVQTGVTNQFSADTIISNASDADITSIENFLTGLAGTQQQRTDTNLQELQSGTQYVGGTGQTPYVLTPAQIAAGNTQGQPG